MMAREVKIAILGDARDFSRAVDSANRDAHRLDGAFGKVGGGIAKIGKAAAIGAAGLAVGGAALAKGFVDAAIESQKVTKQTEAVLKSMGNGAGVTAKQVAKLSEKLSMQTGVDDELIQSGQNLLLTFGNLRNGTKKTEKNFDRATAAALDMSVAMKMDMKSASILVGKALNDPIKGLTSLTRAGIQFTDQQKNQIKAMVAVGDTAGAQRIMLSELERQFGGSAAAQATAGEKLKVIWGNLQEQLGAKLLPVFERVATWLADNLPRAIVKAEEFWARIRPSVEDAAAAVRDFVEKVLVALKAWWDDNGATVIAAAEDLRDGVKAAFAKLIEAGKFVIEHWDKFKYLAGVMATAVIGHYVKLGVSAVASATTQAGAWVSMKAAAIASKAETAAIIALMIADWVKLAGKAVFHAAVVVAAWVSTQLAALRASAVTIGAATAQGGAWAGLAVAAEGASARIAKSWLAALGPAAAVIAAAETINNLTGQKMNPNGLSLLERLNPFKAFRGLSFSLPRFDDGGVMPGQRGVHSLAWVAGGETVLPTHSGPIGPVRGGVTNVFNITTLDPAAAARAVKDALRMADARGVA